MMQQSQRKPQGQEAQGGAEKDSLASILSFNERKDLVNLVEAITASIVGDVADAFQDPNSAKDGGESQERRQNLPGSYSDIEALRRSTLNWYAKWKSRVLKRISEAANTRWEPLDQKSSNEKPKSWDELSWDDDPVEKEPAHPPTIDKELQALYPPVDTPLSGKDHDKRLLLMHSMLLLLLSLKHYYAPSRLLMLRLVSSLNLTTDDLDKDEEKTATSLVSGAKALSANEEVEQKAQENQSARGWKVFGASVAGAAIIGLTGGLAAPLVAAGIGTVMGGLGLGATAAAGLLGSLAGSSVLVGGLFGAYGARMTGKMMEEYAREISDFAFVPLHSESRSEDVKEIEAADRRLRVTIGISGWLTEKSDVVEPWRVLGAGTEVFALRWELEALSKLGSGLREMITSAAWNYARTEILRLTVFSTLLGAVALPLGLLQLGKFVDNPFRIAKTRADKAGEVLADAIINRAQGERPVTLVGYSLGARLIYSCLDHLARRQAFGLVESVVLYGAPVPSSDYSWTRMRAVVGGRLVNIYSENDYVLGFLYRANSAQVGIAGLQKIESSGIENCNLSDVVTSHFQYRHLIGQTLHNLGWKDLNSVELRREKEALAHLEEQERKIAEILRDENTNVEEKKELKRMMETQAPVRRASSVGTGERSESVEDEKPPQLPPRRTNMGALSQKEVHEGDEKDSKLASSMPTQHKAEQPQHPTGTHERSVHKEEDDDEDLESKFQGITMEDND